jgi:hypothetical protein
LNSRKFPIAVVVLAICGALALAGIALAANAETKVTIQAQVGGFFGFVHSSKQSCEAGRKVALFKQKGSTQNLSQDTKIGTDIAQPNGPDSQWSINTNKTGRFYAHVGKIPGCKPDFSRTVHSQ